MTGFTHRGLHGQVVNALGARIMRGELQPGQSLDTDTLMSEFDVSRTVIREALRALTAKGLVDARPKHGTFVTERERWQLLDADVMNWRSSGSPDGRLVLELDQVRVIIEPAAAALAATMRNDEQLEEISKALAQLVTSHRADSRIDHVDADVAFHLAVLAASGNELLTHFEVVLEPAIRARHELALEHLTGHEYLDAHRGVYEAIAEGSAESARAQMTELMTRSAQDIEEILQTGSHTTT